MRYSRTGSGLKRKHDCESSGHHCSDGCSWSNPHVESLLITTWLNVAFRLSLSAVHIIPPVIATLKHETFKVPGYYCKKTVVTFALVMSLEISDFHSKTKQINIKKLLI